MRDAEIAHNRHHAARHVTGLVARGAGQHRSEFLAAQPGAELLAGQRAGQGAGNLPQAVVAGHVAMQVVVLLELVHIQDQQAQCLAALARPGHGRDRLALEVAPVADAGQGVDVQVGLHLPQLLFGLAEPRGQGQLTRLEAADVAQEQQAADLPAVQSGDPLHGELEGLARRHERRGREAGSVGGRVLQRGFPAGGQGVAAAQGRPELRRGRIEFDDDTMAVDDHAAFAEGIEHPQAGVVADIVKVRAQRAEPDQRRHQRERRRRQVPAQRPGPAVEVGDIGNQGQGQARRQDGAAPARQGPVGHFGRHQEIQAHPQQQVRPDGHRGIADAMVEHRAGQYAGRHQRDARPDQPVALVGEDHHHGDHGHQHGQPQPGPGHHIARAAQVHHRHQPADRHGDDSDVLDLGPQDAPLQVGGADLEEAAAAPGRRAECQHQERLDGRIVAPRPGGDGHADAGNHGDGKQENQGI
ncbi:hypothetical protein D9M72_331670 [compost metagenome]